MANLKDRLETALEERKANQSILGITTADKSPDQKREEALEAALKDALELVAQGKLARAYRTKYGALVTTAASDPENSPAAPTANN
jgi:hypothetical protein